ncbi:MAG: hypothetical protein ABI134_21520, partial [Byssovorax sp.]
TSGGFVAPSAVLRILLGDAESFDLTAVRSTVRKSIEIIDECVAPSVPSAMIEAANEFQREAMELIESAWSDDSSPLADIVPYSVGVAFGRFDSRFATGDRLIPAAPGPFEPIPTHSPGMLAESQSSWRLGVLTAPPPLLVDDPGHAHDITTASKALFDLVHLGAPEDLRRIFVKDFFSAHIKRYSKSRRKAPIYWQIATPSASYSIWLYYHRFFRDTFYTVQNDYVAPKLRHEESKLESLLRDAGPNPSAVQRKEFVAQEQFVDELRAFLEEVKRIAPLWRPDLDDGVIINFAPLWRLVPQHRAWQKECKDCWDSLCAGEYDWAHLAMHLWPERVVPKCATDRSLAIAHGLENVFWLEDAAGKWKPRPEPTMSLEALVQERSSREVKAALKSLLEAPTAGSGGAKRGGGKGAKRGKAS